MAGFVAEEKHMSTNQTRAKSFVKQKLFKVIEVFLSNAALSLSLPMALVLHSSTNIYKLFKKHECYLISIVVYEIVHFAEVKW